MFEKIKYNLKRRFFRNMEQYDITLSELKKKQQNGAIIIDVRNNREYAENHINGAINIPEYEIDNSFYNKIRDKQKEIIVYCSSGYRSTKAYKKLKKLGYSNVYNLYGGLENY